MITIRTASGSKYEVHEDNTFVRLSEVPTYDDDTLSPIDPPCGMYGTVLRPEMLEVGFVLIGRCNCGCGRTLRSTSIKERIDA